MFDDKLVKYLAEHRMYYLPLIINKQVYEYSFVLLNTATGGSRGLANPPMTPI